MFLGDDAVFSHTRSMFIYPIFQEMDKIKNISPKYGRIQKLY
jgi:hypothetical protein